MRIANDATFEEFYERIRQTYRSNNHVYKVKVEFFDGFTDAVDLEFNTTQGFKLDQMQRKGTIDCKVD